MKITSHHVRRLGMVALAISQMTYGALPVWAATASTDNAVADQSRNTTSPIKHVIVIIGENRSFDHVFATSEPAKRGESVWNLLSEGIVKRDGSPGPNFYRAQQQAAADPGGDTFLLSPPKSTFPKGVLPAPLTGGPKDSYITGDSVALAKASENGLPDDYYPSLVTGGTGQDSKVPDARIKNVDALPTGPFQLTNSNT